MLFQLLQISKDRLRGVMCNVSRWGFIVEFGWVRNEELSVEFTINDKSLSLCVSFRTDLLRWDMCSPPRCDPAGRDKLDPHSRLWHPKCNIRQHHLRWVVPGEIRDPFKPLSVLRLFVEAQRSTGPVGLFILYFWESHKSPAECCIWVKWRLKT